MCLWINYKVPPEDNMSNFHLKKNKTDTLLKRNTKKEYLIQITERKSYKSIQAKYPDGKWNNRGLQQATFEIFFFVYVSSWFLFCVRRDRFYCTLNMSVYLAALIAQTAYIWPHISQIYYHLIDLILYRTSFRDKKSVLFSLFKVTIF